MIPETIDDLLAAMEKPHIPIEEKMAKDDDDYVHSRDEDGAAEALGIKMGTVPPWLEQRYKSKFPRKKVKETQEEKAEQEKKRQDDVTSKKRKATEDAMVNMAEVLQTNPGPEAHIQDRRDWDMRMMQSMQRMLTSPRAKKKVGLYVTKRQKTERDPLKKALVKELTNLKADGGTLEGGLNKETYNYKMLQKVTKKAKQKEDKKKAEAIAKLKKGMAVQKMIATKKKKKEEAAAAKAAADGAAEAEDSEDIYIYIYILFPKSGSIVLEQSPIMAMSLCL